MGPVDWRYSALAFGEAFAPKASLWDRLEWLAKTCVSVVLLHRIIITQIETMSWIVVLHSSAQWHFRVD